MTNLTPERIAERQCQLALALEEHYDLRAGLCRHPDITCIHCAKLQELLEALNEIISLQSQLQLATERAEKAEAELSICKEMIRRPVEDF